MAAIYENFKGCQLSEVSTLKVRGFTQKQLKPAAAGQKQPNWLLLQTLHDPADKLKEIKEAEDERDQTAADQWV